MNDNDEFLDLINSRLHYLLGECTPEEYNPELVNALIQLKRTLYPQSDESVVKNITYHNPDAQKHRIIHISYKSPTKKRAVTALGIAIAACILSIMLIGNNSPSKALPDTGFFLFLKKDKEGILAITSPDRTKEINDTCLCCPKCDCGCSSATNNKCNLDNH